MYPMTARRFPIAFLASVIVLAASGSALAQSTQVDPRWHAWVGCWARVAARDAATSQPVCVIPVAGNSAVDIVTVTGGRISSREHIEANGERRPTERDGCAGWERAQWSPDGRRVYLESEFACPSNVKRSSSGLIAMSLKGEWLNVLGVTIGEATGVRVLRHRALDQTAAIPAEIRSALEPHRSFGDGTRTLAAAPVGTADVVDAARQLNPAVVEAWLTELQQRFSVDARGLVALADANVPDGVIDVMVALSYPEAFAVKPSTTEVGSLIADEGFDRGGAAGGSAFGCGSYGFSLYGWDDCYLYGYFPSAYSYSRYGSYGYSPYGYGYDPYTGWYAGGAPVVITLQPRGNDSESHGRVINGRGYSSGSSGDASSSSSSSGSSGSSSSSGTGGSATSSSGGERTAQPR